MIEPVVIQKEGSFHTLVLGIVHFHGFPLFVVNDLEDFCGSSGDRARTFQTLARSTFDIRVVAMTCSSKVKVFILDAKIEDNVVVHQTPPRVLAA